MDVDHRSKGSFLDFPDGPPPSQTDNTVQMILQKQLETKITLHSQFQQHRSFCDAGELSSMPESSGGLHSVQELKSLEEEVACMIQLGRAGLNQREIELYLNADRHDNKYTDNVGSCVAEPEAAQKRLEELKSRVANKQNLTQNATVESCGRTLPEDPFTYIARLSKKIDSNRKRKKRKLSLLEEDETKDIDIREAVDPSLWHAVIPLQDEDILSNRLSLDEICQMPRFANYEPGTPHSALYLKNLQSKVRVEELIAIFSRYDGPEGRVKYRLMTGRMKGQAFVQFPSVEAATQALQLANGYKLRGQPLIVTFAHRKETQRQPLET